MPSSTTQTIVITNQINSQINSEINSEIISDGQRNEAIFYLKGIPAYTITLQFSSVIDFNFSATNHTTFNRTTGYPNRGNSNYSLPACTVYDGVTYVPCKGCGISSYTNYNVTYSCFDITQLCQPASATSTATSHATSSRRLSSATSSASSSRRLSRNDNNGNNNHNNNGNGNKYHKEYTEFTMQEDSIVLEEIKTSEEELSTPLIYGSLFKSVGSVFESVLSQNPFTSAVSPFVLIFVGCLSGFIILTIVYLLRLDSYENTIRIYLKHESDVLAKRRLMADIRNGNKGDLGEAYRTHRHALKDDNHTYYNNKSNKDNGLFNIMQKSMINILSTVQTVRTRSSDTTANSSRRESYMTAASSRRGSESMYVPNSTYGSNSMFDISDDFTNSGVSSGRDGRKNSVSVVSSSRRVSISQDETYGASNGVSNDRPTGIASGKSSRRVSISQEDNGFASGASSGRRNTISGISSGNSGIASGRNRRVSISQEEITSYTANTSGITSGTTSVYSSRRNSVSGITNGVSNGATSVYSGRKASMSPDEFIQRMDFIDEDYDDNSEDGDDNDGKDGDDDDNDGDDDDGDNSHDDGEKKTTEPKLEQNQKQENEEEDEEDEQEEIKIARQAVITDFLDKLFQGRSIFASKNNVIAIIVTYHEYFKMLGGSRLTKTRVIRFIEVVSMVLARIFAATVFFSVFFPQNSECTVYEEEVSGKYDHIGFCVCESVYICVCVLSAEF